MDLETIALGALGAGFMYFVVDRARANNIYKITDGMIFDAARKRVHGQPLTHTVQEPPTVTGPYSYSAKRHYERVYEALQRLGEEPTARDVQELFDIK